MPDSPASPLVIRLLGPLDVRVRGAALPPVRSQKVKWLLALLVLQYGRQVPRIALAEQLWPDTDPDKALNNLSQSLSNLCRALGPEQSRIQKPDKHTLCLTLAGADVDLFAFEARIRKGDLPSLEQAVELYAGPLLEGCADAWAHHEREKRSEMYQRALSELSAHARGHGDFVAAERYLRLTLRSDCWNEGVRRDLMQVLAHAGDSLAALTVYRDWVRLLQQEAPGTAPDPVTTAVYDKLRSSARPSRVSSAPDHSLASRARHTLPAALTGLVGRAEAIKQISTCLYRDRLITLRGPGGIGKTRLALSVAEAVQEEFEAGAWFVDLASLSDPQRVEAAVISALQLREGTGKSRRQLLIDFLRDKHLLLLLDNCEHVLEACRDLVSALLVACPHLIVLATSRQSLRLAGETSRLVSPLDVPSPGSEKNEEQNMVDWLLDHAGIRLFVERAQAVEATFTLTSSNASAVTVICQQLDGIPLALELAAARTNALSVDQIALRLADRFALLGGGDPTRPQRYQTLQATLDWSYALLTGQEQCLLHRLSVFSGGWTLAAVESVCAGKGIENAELIDLLTGLVDKSLVVYEAREAEDRYRLLETVRQYAAEKLSASAEEGWLRGRHLNYYLRLAEQSEPGLRGSEQLTVLSRLDPELNNFRAALSASLMLDSSIEKGMRLAAALAWYWYRRSHVKEGQEWLETFLKHSELQADTAIRAHALLGAGMLAYYLIDRPKSISLLAEATRIYRALGDSRGVAESLIYQGVCATLLEKFDEAEALAVESVELARNVGDPWILGMALWGMGVLLMQQSKHGAGQRIVEESIELFRGIGDKWGIGAPLRVLGKIMEDTGNLVQARDLVAQALDAARAADDCFRRGYFAFCLGEICYRMEEFEEAILFYQESLHVQRQFGNRMDTIWTVMGLARTLRRLGQSEASRLYYLQGFELARRPSPVCGIEPDALNTVASEAEGALREMETGPI